MATGASPPCACAVEIQFVLALFKSRIQQHQGDQPQNRSRWIDRHQSTLYSRQSASASPAVPSSTMTSSWSQAPARQGGPRAAPLESWPRVGTHHSTVPTTSEISMPIGASLARLGSGAATAVAAPTGLNKYPLAMVPSFTSRTKSVQRRHGRNHRIHHHRCAPSIPFGIRRS